MGEKTRSADELVRLIEMNPELLEAVKANPLPELKKISTKAKKATEGPIYLQDKLLYRIAIGVLGTLAILAAVGSIIFVSLNKTTPEVLVALGSAAVGALVGIFAPSPASK